MKKANKAISLFIALSMIFGLFSMMPAFAENEKLIPTIMLKSPVSNPSAGSQITVRYGFELEGTTALRATQWHTSYSTEDLTFVSLNKIESDCSVNTAVPGEIFHVASKGAPYFTSGVTLYEVTYQLTAAGAAKNSLEFSFNFKSDDMVNFIETGEVFWNDNPSMTERGLFDATPISVSIGNTNPQVPVETVTITSGVNTVMAGRTIQLTADVHPENATNRNVSWSITNGSEHGEINPVSGRLKGLSEGTVEVVATAGGVSSEPLAITVTPAPINTDNVQFTVAGAIAPMGAGLQSLSEVYPGQEYELKISLSDMMGAAAITLPITFDNEVVEILGITKGAAYTSDWNHMITVDEANTYLPYQFGTIPHDDYTKINEAGIMLFTLTLQPPALYEGIDIPALSDPTQASDSEMFFVVKFKVKEDAEIDSIPSFAVVDQANKLDQFNFYGWAHYEYHGRDESGHIIYDTAALTGTFDNQPIVTKEAPKTISVEIVDFDTKNASDLKSIHFADESFRVDKILKWDDDTIINNPDEITWTATNGRVDVINGVPTYIPEAGYTGPVTITVTAVKDGKEADDTYTFEVIDLVITNPSDKVTQMDTISNPSLDLESEFLGNVPGGKSNVRWKVKKNGMVVDADEYLSDPTSLTPTFTPDGPGEYELIVESEEYPELFDYVIINVADTRPYVLTGNARLGSKSRNGNILYGYDPVALGRKFDEGIKVELVNVASTLPVAVTYTDESGKYQLNVNPAIDLKGDGKFMLRFSRVGSNGDTVRNESYLYAELPLEVTASITAGTEITIARTVTLYAGSFISNSSEKQKVSSSDYQTVKGFVGLVSTDEGYDTAVDINEYGGVEGGDLNIVRINMSESSKTVAKYKVN